jgi:hypothetical protein
MKIIRIIFKIIFLNDYFFNATLISLHNNYFKQTKHKHHVDYYKLNFNDE